LFLEKNRIALDVRQLSEGERGLLAIVLDIARRLSQANPSLADPIKQGKAVVLIDELDLHLHPKWQRSIVEQLTRTFPRCQFIATTHSPQIVAAVEPEQVLLLTDTGVVRPDRTLGMDSNWILRHLMQADDRPVRAGQAIRGVEALIKKGTFIRARKVIAEAKEKGLDLPEWSVLEARMARLEVLSK
jgi:ribonuclease HI